MTLAEFIMASSARIISEWEEFARSCTPAAQSMDLAQRRDHIAEMLKAIALDLESPQTKREQREKSIGNGDADVDSVTAANSHGADRAASGYTPVQMVSEFRALRASVVRLWAQAQSQDATNCPDLEEITRFNEAVDQLLAESMVKYAKDVDRVQDIFLGVLGHDLRNPLGAIMMSATVMMTKEGPDWPHLKTASRILSSGTRMDLLIGDLLDFTRSRLGSGIPIERTEMDMEITGRLTVDEIAAFHPRRTLTFETSGDVRGEWDHSRIAQALSNLLGNACQHGAPNEPIQVVASGEPHHVVVTVHNKGPVIPKAHLHDIFNPFKQLGSASTKAHRGSVGLGLYIVQAIVSAHGGTIDVQSDEAGTTFTMRLPRTA